MRMLYSEKFYCSGNNLTPVEQFTTCKHHFSDSACVLFSPFVYNAVPISIYIYIYA